MFNQMWISILVKQIIYSFFFKFESYYVLQQHGFLQIIFLS